MYNNDSFLYTLVAHQADSTGLYELYYTVKNVIRYNKLWTMKRWLLIIEKYNTPIMTTA